MARRRGFLASFVRMVGLLTGQDHRRRLARAETQRQRAKQRYERWLIYESTDLSKALRIERYNLIAKRIGLALYRNRTRRTTIQTGIGNWWDLWWFRLADDGTIVWKGTGSAFGPFKAPFDGSCTPEHLLALDPDMPPGTSRLYARLVNDIHAAYMQVASPDV